MRSTPAFCTTSRLEAGGADCAEAKEGSNKGAQVAAIKASVLTGALQRDAGNKRNRRNGMVKSPLLEILFCTLPFQHAAPHLVQFYRLKQGLEVALTEAVVALALDEFKKDRAELVFAEDLQQQRAFFAIDEHLALLEGGHVFAVAGDAFV